MEVFFLTDNRQLKDFFAEKIVLTTKNLCRGRFLLLPQAFSLTDN